MTIDSALRGNLAKTTAPGNRWIPIMAWEWENKSNSVPLKGGTILSSDNYRSPTAGSLGKAHTQASGTQAQSKIKDNRNYPQNPTTRLSAPS